MSRCVNVLLPNGRRRNIKLSPNTIVSQTLGDVCKQEGCSSENFSFLFQRKILDEALSWRYANVPNNAKLELVKREKSKQESPVRIALQYGDGERLQGTFKPSTMLSELLDHWKNELSLVKCEDNVEPCIVYVRQEIFGRSKLSTTTLKSLGLTSGSAVMRLSFKPGTGDVDSKSVPAVEKPVESASQVNESETQPVKMSQPLPIPNKSLKVTPPPPQATPTSLSKDTQVMITQTMLTAALKNVTSDESFHSDSVSSDNTDTVMLQFDGGDKTKTQNDMHGGGTNGISQNAAATSSRSRMRMDSKEMPRKRQKQVSPPPDPQPDFSDFKFPEETAGMNIYSPEEEEEISIEPLMNPCDRDEIFFDEKEVTNKTVGTEVEEPGDEFFELTINDIRRMITELRTLQNDSAEKPLVTARSKELQRLRAINQYPKIIIRIIFPNRKIVQGFFCPAEKVEVLYEFVTQFLISPTPSFFLYTTPPKFVLKNKNAILYDCNLSPASKVYFGLDDVDFNENMFSEKVDVRKGSVADADIRFVKVFELKTPENRSRPTAENQTTVTTSSVNEGPSTSGQQISRNNQSGARPKVPKWFKLGKK